MTPLQIDYADYVDYSDETDDTDYVDYANDHWQRCFTFEKLSLLRLTNYIPLMLNKISIIPKSSNFFSVHVSSGTMGAKYEPASREVTNTMQKPRLVLPLDMVDNSISCPGYFGYPF